MWSAWDAPKTKLNPTTQAAEGKESCEPPNASSRLSFWTYLQLTMFQAEVSTDPAF